jgi:hypothetical protein
MITYFKKNNIIKAFEIQDNKVFTTITLEDFNVTNPSLEQFLSIGWEEYIPHEPEPYVPTLEELVEQKIRQRYTLNQEFEVNRKRDVDTQAFAEYYQFVEDCIAEAKQELNIVKE